MTRDAIRGAPRERRILLNGKFLSAPATGVQRVARELVRALGEDLSDDPGGCRWELLLPSDADETFVPGGISRRQLKGRGAAWEQLALARASTGSLLVNLANSAPVLHRRSVVMLHDAQVFDMPGSYPAAFRAWYRFLHPALGRKALRILTVSGFSAERLAANGIVDDALVIPNGFDHILRVDPSSDALSRYGLAPGGYVIAFASAQGHKNTRLLLDMFATPRADGVMLALVGDTLPSGAVLPGSQTRLLGRVSDKDLRALYTGAAVFLSPSLTEGFGLPAGEAAMCGTAVIAARAGAQAEIWDSAGLCEPPDDPAAWLRRLDSILGDSGRRQKAAAAALGVAIAYTWRSSARKVRRVVELLAGAG